MKNILSTVFCVIFSLVVLQSMASLASMLPPKAPQPPAVNPHPPLTEQDKARVAFADLAIKKLLMSSQQLKNVDASLSENQSVELNLSADCLKLSECVKQNSVRAYTDSLKSKYGVLEKNLHTHIIPWSFENFKKRGVATEASRAIAPQADSTISDMPVPVLKEGEYMLHSYVQFKNSDTGVVSEWYHLDTIVTEDEKGSVLLKRFFLAPIPSAESRELPPGVVC